MTGEKMGGNGSLLFYAALSKNGNILSKGNSVGGIPSPP